jgi:AcrR family transcriptional regulator
MGRKSIKHIRQKEIVEAFYEVARAEGLENASISKVAARLLINPSLIIHYFDTREELILALIEYNLERYTVLFDIRNHYADSYSRIIAMINALFSKQWNMLFDDGVFYSCYALIFRDEKIKSRYKFVHDSLRQFLASLLEEGVKEGILLNTDTEKTAGQIFLIVEGAYYYLNLVDDKEEYAEKLNEYKRLSLSMLQFRHQPSFSGK